MNETDSTIKDELNTRKEILNNHLAKFNQLKNECKWSEAWQQLLVTLTYANDTLRYSGNLLKSISRKMPQLSPEQQAKINDLCSGDQSADNTLSLKNVSGSNTEKPTKPAIKKMIVIPKKQNIH